MTVQDTANFIDYVGDGTTTAFVFTFRVDDASWLVVDFVDDLGTPTLNINQHLNPGGTVNYLVAPPDGQDIHISRDTPQSQEIDYTRYDPFDSESHEDALDKLEMQIQDLSTQIDDLENVNNTGFAWEFVPFNGDRTLVLTDAYKMVQSIDGAGTQTVTVPPNSDVAFDLGTQITFEQKGIALLDFAEGAGVNIDAPGQLNINRRFGTATLVQDEIDNWVLLGNISP